MGVQMDALPSNHDFPIRFRNVFQVFLRFELGFSEKGYDMIQKKKSHPFQFAPETTAYPVHLQLFYRSSPCPISSPEDYCSPGTVSPKGPKQETCLEVAGMQGEVICVCAIWN